MKKKITVFLLTAVVIMNFFACGNDGGASENKGNSNSDTIKIDKTVDAVADALELKNKQEKAYEIIGASDGAGFDDNIEIYIYDDQDSDAYKAITGDGYDTELGVIKAAASNDGVILIYTGEGSAEIQLVDKFRALQFK